MNSYERYVVLRDNKGYTDYRVCKLADIETATISSWKTGRYEPKLQTLLKIAEVLECNIYDFYCDRTENEDKAMISKFDIEQLKQQFDKLLFSLSNVYIQTMQEIEDISQTLDNMLGTCELQDQKVDNSSLLGRIKFLCKEKNIPLYKLEDDLGFARGYISKIDKSSPTVKNAKKIAEYFGITVSDLIE